MIVGMTFRNHSGYGSEPDLEHAFGHHLIPCVETGYDFPADTVSTPCPDFLLALFFLA